MLPDPLQGGRGREARQSCRRLARPFLGLRSAFCLEPQAHHPLRVSLRSLRPHTPGTPSSCPPVPLSACRPGSGRPFPGARTCLCPRFCVTYLSHPFWGGVCVDTLHVRAVPCVTTHSSPDEGRTRTSEKVGEGGSFSLPLSVPSPPPLPLEMVRQRLASTPQALSPGLCLRGTSTRAL